MNWYLVVKVTKGVPSTFSSLPSLHLFIIIWYQTEPIQGSQITSSCAYLLWQQVPYVPYYTITNSPLALLLLHIKTLPTHFSSHLDGTDIVAQECLFQLRQTFATNFRHILQQYNKEFLNPCVYYFHSIHVVA